MASGRVVELTALSLAGLSAFRNMGTANRVGGGVCSVGREGCVAADPPQTFTSLWVHYPV